MAAVDAAVAGFRVKLDSTHCACVCDSTRRQAGDEGRCGVRGEVTLASQARKNERCGAGREGKGDTGSVTSSTF